MYRIIRIFVLALVLAFVCLSCDRTYGDKFSLTVRQDIIKGYAICKISELKLDGLKINYDLNCLSPQGDSIAFKDIIKEGKFVILYDSRKCDICFDEVYNQIRECFPFMLTEDMIVFTNYKNAKILRIAKQDKMKKVSIFNIKSSFFDEFLPSSVALAFVTNDLIFKDVYVITGNNEMVEVTKEYLKKIKNKYYIRQNAPKVQ